MMKHLSLRVPWHDNVWNGSVCKNPKANTYCTNLPRIYVEKKDEEKEFANESWDKLTPSQLPPCKAEGGAFLNEKQYIRCLEHPYRYSKKAQHSHLEPTDFEVPPFTTFSVPFWWMLRKNQKTIQNEYPNISQDEKPPFITSWVYGKERQEELIHNFFRQLKSKKSLVFFYTKSGNPIDENTKRLLVGAGTIDEIGHILRYKKNGAGKDYPIWDRMVTHSVRPLSNKDSDRGILLPYHEYLNLNDDYIIDINGAKKTKQDLLEEIKMPLIQPGSDEALLDAFSYVSQLITNRQALFILSSLRNVIGTIKQHGIVDGHWDKKIVWLNDQIGMIKEIMGPFPSFSHALVSLGFDKGHLFAQDIYENCLCEPKGDPWNVLNKILNGDINLNNNSYNLVDLRNRWQCLDDIEKSLLILLSRFELTSKQIKRWFNPEEREKYGVKITAEEIINNPYVISEEDDGDKESYPISVENIDLGIFEDKEIQGKNIPQPPQLVESNIDSRRIRAIVVELLQNAANDGDTLLSWEELREKLSELRISKSAEIPNNFFKQHLSFLTSKLVYIVIRKNNAFQLAKYNDIDDYLEKIFKARASRKLPVLNENWSRLIINTANSSGVSIDNKNIRHKAALDDQVKALETVTSHKLSVLHGPAGTGKTTVMGALFRSEILRAGGILLLAPTGKARVKLASMAGGNAYTIAQFLNKLGRFDWELMKPKFTGKNKYQGEKTVIIDECSMLTEDDFYALFSALDLAYVERIILVGDPYQLPPIGAGRPFADFCSYLQVDKSNNDQARRKSSEALAKLEVVVRTAGGEYSDTLLLASWYAGIKPSKNADLVISKFNNNHELNDLRIESWTEPDKLEALLGQVLKEELNLEQDNEIIGFSKALGFENDKFDIEKPEKVENIQMLSPVKNPPWGAFPLNRFIQQHYRERNIPKWEFPLGDQQIWKGDKVIQLVNEKREGYNRKTQEKDQFQLSNGQIGYVVNYYKGFANVCYASLPSLTFGYSNRDFSEDSGKIELAYVITVHKSQGSDFDKVILILPQKGRILSRELIYTALTRTKQKLILLVEGDDPHWIINYSRPENSETSRRNTRLFEGEDFELGIRELSNSIPYVENLIHRTKDGKYVRSKSEVIIANLLVDAGLIDYEYEKPFKTIDGIRLPDFTFIDAAGDIIILEHLGMLHKKNYRSDWEAKKLFYDKHGIREGENLFITKDDENGAIDAKWISDNVIEKIKYLVL